MSKNNQPHPPSFYLTCLYDLIQAGKAQSDIAKELNLSKQNLYYYRRQLLEAGFIQRIAYGTWETCKPLEVKEVKTINPGRSNNPPSFFTSSNKPKKDHIRGHAFTFRVKLPSIPNWKDREAKLKALNLRYETLEGNQGQRIWIADNKVWLCNNALVFFFRDSFFADTAKGSNSQALATLEKRIRTLERLLGVSFEINGGHIFRVCRWHFSLVNNSLATQYNEDGRRLYVRNHKGLWLIIDNSHHQNELETVHQDSAMMDNVKVDNWFNGLEALPPIPAFTPQMVLSAIGQTNENLNVLIENVAALTEKVKELEKVR